jgi:hypothetical protein
MDKFVFKDKTKPLKLKFKVKNIKNVFVCSGSADSSLPFCFLCNRSLSNESSAPNKLETQLQTTILI